ncbi:hypothetical protein ARMGADRAFT_1063247 [Armillaria gallica]|uniref:Uncharacterized protein n=1 Tax=Armillaria gallica TaxID=47427 RepID=A0A2H3E0A0_ARMGA|nr:hypothetical protein ARMGADRAFT_1063247 [Armillaria gallica]
MLLRATHFLQMVDVDADAGLVLAFWHAHEPDLHCGMLTFSWKWLALTPVFDRYTKQRRSNQYDLDVTRLSYRRAYALLVHGTDIMLLYDSDADLTVMWQWNIARENRDKDVDLRLESDIRAPDLADVRVRENDAAVEGDDALIADIYGFYSGQSLLHDGLRVVLRVGSTGFGGMGLQNPTKVTVTRPWSVTSHAAQQKQPRDFLQASYR